MSASAVARRPRCRLRPVFPLAARRQSPSRPPWSPRSLPAVPAAAAGIERVVPSARILFREGAYAEFNLAVVSPTLRGRDADLSAVGLPLQYEGRTNDIFETFSQISLGLRGDITDRLSYALVFDEPWGADTSYGRGTFPPQDFAAVPPSFSYEGTLTDLRSYAFTTILAYDVMPNVKVFGGLRAQRVEAEAAIPFVGPTLGRPGYTLTTDRDMGWGYMVGAGYSLPEIALNVSLTYYSRIDHTVATTEFGTDDTSFGFETPQAVNLEFQSGVAADTLVFGSVRWVDWSSFVISPPSYVAAVGAPLVAYENDWWTYTLGVGRRFTEQWSGALQASLRALPGRHADDPRPRRRPHHPRRRAHLHGRSARVDRRPQLRLARLDPQRPRHPTSPTARSSGIGLRIGYSF
jgi:long-chain fatty acid transport protein